MPTTNNISPHMFFFTWCVLWGESRSSRFSDKRLVPSLVRTRVSRRAFVKGLRALPEPLSILGADVRAFHGFPFPIAVSRCIEGPDAREPAAHVGPAFDAARGTGVVRV